MLTLFVAACRVLRNIYISKYTYIMLLVKQLKALSEETRLRLFHLLLHYELSVNEIVTVLEMVQPRISRHLKILVDSGFLCPRRDGGFVYYSGVKSKNNSLFVKLVTGSLGDESVCKKDMDRAEAIIRERKNRTKRFFESVAETWEDRKHEVLGGLDLNRIIAERLPPGCIVADLGCGTGSLAEVLCEKASYVIGVDSSAGMLQQAAARIRGVEGVNIRLGELEYLPLKDGEVHCAVMNMVLHHVSEPPKVLAEAYRVLKPAGLFLVADFDKHKNITVRDKIGGAWFGFSRQELNKWLSDAGFSEIGVETFPVNYGLTVNLFSSIKNNNHNKS